MARYALTASDWSWIAGFLVVAFGMALYHARRSSQSVERYFVAGKRAPWWVLGTSIVATTFAADTPLVICGLVLTDGISGNWFWWSVVPSGMLGVFFFARLWRRSGCLTQAEFAILRYGDHRARILRLVYVFYHGVIRNAVTLGFVNLAMAKVITLCTPFDHWEALAVCFVLTVLYTTLGGISGVMYTDVLQFVLALAVAVGIAGFGVRGAGGWDVVREFAATGGALSRSGESWLGAYLPPLHTTAWWSFIIFVTLYWISATPTDCTGYAVQRLLSARDERHAVWGYLWFNIAHYVVRSWPWIITGLAAACLYGVGTANAAPDGADVERAYIRVILDTAPAWFIGPALASLVAAYMSTVDTHLNWSASYLVHDLYRAYIRPGRSDRHYVWVSYAATVLIAVSGVAATAFMDSIVQGWGLLFGLLSGMGIVGILRWLWWRVTAWTEIGCMAGAGLGSIVTYAFPEPLNEFPFTLLIIVPLALLGAAIGTFAVAPEPRNVLVSFANRVRPPGAGWRRVLAATPAVGCDVQGLAAGTSTVWRPALSWVAATAAVYCALFGVGDLLLKSAWRGAGLCLVAAALAVGIGASQRAAAKGANGEKPLRRD